MVNDQMVNEKTTFKGRFFCRPPSDIRLCMDGFKTVSRHIEAISKLKKIKNNCTIICIFQKKAVPLPLIFDFNRIKMQNMRHFDEEN